MIETLIHMMGLIACGLVWQIFRPGSIDTAVSRKVLTDFVYYLFLPALVLTVLWQAPLGINSIRISFIAASNIIVWLLISWAVYRLLRQPRQISGALILAAAFPNATYLGLPVLEHTLGNWARSVAIEYDLFACTPLLLTVGILVARAHGESRIPVHPLVTLTRIPALWAAMLAVVLNLSAVTMPGWLRIWLDSMASAVIPLMLIALGMSLQLQSLKLQKLPVLMPVLLIQLITMPLFALLLAHISGLSGDYLIAVVLEAAMPSMVLGIVICDQFKLDTGIFAAAVTLSTTISLITLPVWYYSLI
jgi:malate permease and related proteins